MARASVEQASFGCAKLARMADFRARSTGDGREHPFAARRMDVETHSYSYRREVTHNAALTRRP